SSADRRRSYPGAGSFRRGSPRRPVASWRSSLRAPDSDLRGRCRSARPGWSPALRRIETVGDGALEIAPVFALACHVLESVFPGQPLVALVAEDQCFFARFEHDRILDGVALDDLLGQPDASRVADSNDLEFDGLRTFHWWTGLNPARVITVPTLCAGVNGVRG